MLAGAPLRGVALPPGVAVGLALVLLLLLLSPGLRGDSRWRVLLVPTRALATGILFWLALLPPGLAKAALPGDVTLWHYHLDHLGSTHSITDASGNLYRQTRTTAYGEVRGRYDGSGNVVAAEVALRHEFTGYQSEEKSGLQYAGARYYLPELGVFTSHDPAGQFPSPYAYGPGDPVNGTDPNGSFFSLFRALFKAIVSFFKTLFKTGDVVEALGAAGIDFVSSVANYAVASVAQNEQLGAFVGGAVRAALQHAVQGYSTAPEKEGSKGAQRAARLGRDLVDAVFGREKTDSGRSRHQVVSGQGGTGGSRYNQGYQATAGQAEEPRRTFGFINLLDHEGVAGGHTISEHVGKTDQFLANRVRAYGIPRFYNVFRESHSTFTSLQAANSLVSSTLSANYAVITAWLKGERSFLVVRKEFGSITGRGAFRNTGGARSGRGPVPRLQFRNYSAVRVLIVRYPSMPHGFRVHTAFPSLERR